MCYHRAMIAHISGTIAEIGVHEVAIDVGGVGYRIFTTPDVLSQLHLEQHVTLRTHLVVRENVMDLYGFLTSSDLRFFELLMSVSGVGPKSALSILSLADTETLTSAIASGETEHLTKVSGIGKKSAQKIVLELKDKIGVTDSAGIHSDDTDALEALVAMGYTLKEAREAIKAVPKEIDGANERLKAALKTLSR